ncbi:SPOR domain-containing protein [Reyranella sp.]|uniref:SPOR domain-containing protein n=1 Tax=Reyranella sp. TaxID=1929291 RepID=UPI002730975F|nr:SPOR domain-containing protein [Reyranella sp.]MDP2373429.1 SPOR domain-containing protein [Reyranella sp.]
MRRSPSGDGPTIYRPNESVAVRLDPPPRPVAYEPDSIPPPPRDSLLMRVNRRRGQILTVMVSIAAIASFGSVVWWAHNQDVKAGGRGLEPLVVQAPTTPSRVKPENAGGLVPPNQDKEVFNRIAPGAVPSQPEKLLPGVETPKLPAAGLPTPAAPKPEAPAAKTPTPMQPTAPGAGPTPVPAQAATTPPASAQPASATAATTLVPTEAGPSIASLIENMSGPTGGWRVQIASVKSEDVAKSTWARLQSAHGDVLANLRMQAARVDLGDKGVWYRVQAGPLDEKQAQSVCSTLKGRRADCVTVPPAR